MGERAAYLLEVVFEMAGGLASSTCWLIVQAQSGMEDEVVLRKS